MDYTNSTEKFQEIIKNPIYKEFYGHLGKLTSIYKDGGDVDSSIADLIKYIKNNREQIINFFFSTWLASVDDDCLKKEIVRSIFMNKVIVIEERFDPNGFTMKISFQTKEDNNDE